MDTELLKRAVEETVPTDLAKEKLASGKNLRVYMGIDPTGAKLHIGHAVPLRKLQAFADAGHHVIFLVGSFTALVGDPTGRESARPMLTKEQVTKNFETYKEQASRILDFNKVEIRYNHEWLEKMSFAEIMKLASHFTVQQMMQREMFRERVKKEEDLSPNEFLYPLMQGYDSVVLDVDFEIGGNDQLFNMLCGRKLQKAYGKRDKCVLTTKLIEGTDGRKMSKTYDNCVYITDEPNDMYGKILSIKDDLITTYMECCTDIPMEEIKAAEAAMKKKANPKDFKMHLAREIVTLYHSVTHSEAAEAEFITIFSEHGLPEKIQEASARDGTTLIDFLVQQKFISSKSEARRLIEQKGIHFNDELVTIDQLVEEGIVKVGKRKFMKITFKP